VCTRNAAGIVILAAWREPVSVEPPLGTDVENYSWTSRELEDYKPPFPSEGVNGRGIIFHLELKVGSAL